MAPKRQASAAAAAAVAPLLPRSKRATTSRASTGLKKKTWSEEDSLFILKILVEFKAKHGKEPGTKEEFSLVAESVRKHHTDEFSDRQLRDKIRKLREKFFSGRDAGFGHKNSLTEYEKSALDLAQQAWAKDVEEKAGKEGIGVSKTNAKPRPKSSSKKKNKDMNEIAADLVEEEKGEEKEKEEEEEEEQGERGLCPTLVETVRALENKAGSTCGMFERAVKIMQPAKARGWERNLKNLCLAEIDVQRRRHVLESRLLGEIEEMIKNVG